MKTTLFSFIILLSAMNLFGQSNYKLPKEWDKSFVIRVSHTGSMSGGSSHVTFTHDSCKYEVNSLRDASEKKTFLLTQQDREMILAKMKELKVEKVKPEVRYGTQHDGWSTQLCFGWHCIEGGSAAKMSDKNKGIFVDACSFLEEFARSRE